MADRDLDDFDFDERGVYREHGSHGSGDQGIQLDEDGIWRDDADHWSHQTYRTYDSGIAFDRKYTSPAPNRYQGPDLDPDNVPYHNYSRESYTTDSLPPDERSLNISELEASESYLGDEISFGRRSYHSDENLDLPELHDESYLIGSEISRDRVTESATDCSDYGDPNQRGYRRAYEPSEYSDEGDYHKAEKPLDQFNHGDRRPYESSVYRNQTKDKLSVSALKAPESGQPKIVGDSLFTQEEPMQAVGGQSLVEFEQLEAEAFDPILNRGGNPGDNLDLIGAYLQGLESEDGYEDEQGGGGYGDDYSQHSSDHSHRGMDTGLRAGSSHGNDSIHSNTSPRPSKIPMLRSRSPSMSRPGSASPTRGRPRSMSPTYRRRSFSPGKHDTPFSTHSDDRSQSLTVLPQNGHHRDDSVSHEEIDQFTPLQRRHSSKVSRSHSHGSPSFGSQGLQSSRATPDTPEGHSSTSCDEMDELSQSSVLSTRSKDLKKRFLQEKEERKEKEQNLEALEKEYNSLLRKHAEAENIIDKFRLGAKVNLHSAAPVPGQAQAGKMPGPQRAHSFSMLKVGVASLGEMGVNNRLSGSLVQLSSNQANRSDSRLSHASAATWTAPSASTSSRPSGPVTDGLSLPQDEADAIAEEAVKLSLLAKARGIDEQTASFEGMLSDNKLSLDKQEEALKSIKDGVESLHQNYRDAKQQHEYLRRQGLVGSGTGRDSVFDVSNEVNGEIHQLDMKVDNLDQQVQENLKKKSIRVPFQSPLKADHKIDVSKMSDKPNAGGKILGRHLSKTGSIDSDGEGLSPRRPPSVGSIVGAAGDIDQTLHQLNKDYNSLMDRYRVLKQLKRTPERDQEVEELLTKLKQIYVNTPDHRKPALPPELESLYNPLEAAFMTPEEQSEAELRARLEEHQRSSASPSSARREGRRDHHRARERHGEDSRGHGRRRRGDSSSTVPSTIGESSDLSTSERGSRGHRQSSSDRDYGSMSSSTTDNQCRNRRPGLRQLPGDGSSTVLDSDGRKAGHPDPRSRTAGSSRSSSSGVSGSRILPSKPGVRTTRSERGDSKTSKGGRYADVDSGRKRGKDGSGVGTANKSRSHQHIRTSALSPNHHYSDTDSASTASTVEERRRSRHSSGSDSRRKSSRSRDSEADSSRDSRESFSRGRHSESEEVSMISGGKHIKSTKTYQAAPTVGQVNGVGVVTSTSAFTVNQVQPGIVQPRAVQPGMVQANGVSTYVQQPQYQYIQQTAATQQVPQVHTAAPNIAAVAPGVMAPQTVYQTQAAQPQVLGPAVRPSILRPGLPGPRPNQYPGYGNVQAPRPQDRFALVDDYGQTRTRYFGGHRHGDAPQSPEYDGGPYRTTDALVDHDLKHTRRERYPPKRSQGHDDRDVTSRSYEEQHRIRESPYDYRKRFEEIREARYGTKDAKAGRGSRNYNSSPQYDKGYSPVSSRKKTRDYGQERDSDRDDRDYKGRGGYYSDPDSPYRSPDRRSRDYNVHRRSRYPDHDYYDEDYYYEDEPSYGYRNGHENTPLDEKYLTRPGAGYTQASQNGSQYPVYGVNGQSAAAGMYSGTGTGMMDSSIAQHIGVQNVPQMATTGVQYMTQPDPNQGIYNPTNFSMANTSSGAVGMPQSTMVPQVLAGYPSTQGIGTVNQQGVANTLSAVGAVTPGTAVMTPGVHAVNYGASMAPGVQAVDYGTAGISQGVVANQVTSQPMLLMSSDGQTQAVTSGQLPTQLPAQLQAGTSYIPVQLVQNGASGLTQVTPGTVLLASNNSDGAVSPSVHQASTPTSKVRYYVREFGLDSDLEEKVNSGKKANLKSRHQGTPKKSSRASYDSDSDLESDDSLSDWRSASRRPEPRHTAVSHKLSGSLHKQLLRCYRK